MEPPGVAELADGGLRPPGPAPERRLPRSTVSETFVTIGAMAGLLAPVVFVGAVVLAGSSRPALSRWASFVSELGESGSSTATFVNASFLGVGMLLGLFALGLIASGGTGQRAVIVAGLLVGLAGAGFVVMAASACSPGCPIAVVNAEATTADAIHNVAAIAGLIGISLAALQLAEGAPAGFGAPWFRRFSGAAAGAVAAFSATFFGAVLTGSRPAIGVSERVLLFATLLWVEVTAVALFREGRSS